MRVFSSRTSQQWLNKVPQPPGPLPTLPGGATIPAPPEDPAVSEAKRALSDLLRCEHLIMLSGLGTSLCVPAFPGGAKAPTMNDLWSRIQSAFDSASAASTPQGPSFAAILSIAGYPGGSTDIEALMSRCRLAESFLSGPQKDQVERFTAFAESQIINATDFVYPDHPLTAHVEFLRRAARRPQRKSRLKIFTTNYDICFEEAGRQGRYVVVDGFSHTAPPTFDSINFTYETVRRMGNSESFDPIPNSFHLYKLHGSINWKRQNPSGEIVK